MPPLKIDEPACLESGTEISARFNGAFCEAKVRTITMDLRLRVRDPNGDTFIARNPNILTDLKALRIGGSALVRHPSKAYEVEVTVVQIFDYSTYLVDFNDGDVKNLKRSCLHLKSGKHFDESISLDNMPLTQPEKSFPTSSNASSREESTTGSTARDQSVVSAETDESELDSVRRLTRTRRAVAASKPSTSRGNRADSDSSQTDKNSSEDIFEKKEKKLREKSARKEIEESKESLQAQVPKKKVGRKRKEVTTVAKEIPPDSPTPEETKSKKETDYPVRSIVCVPQIGRKRCRWIPALVVHPESRKKSKVDTSVELLVRLFSNGSFRKVSLSQVKPFSESCYSGPEEERAQKFEPDYALVYLNHQILPPTWNATVFSPCENRESSEDAGDRETSATRDDAEDESEATRFMIQFIKYRDEIGKPYDDDACVGAKAVDMYKLHRVVHEAGGFNRCNQENKWLEICEELELKSIDKGQDLKNVYSMFLHGFESIFRTLATSITDIRLGRKRHQPAPQESVVEPERRLSSPAPKRARGRPPGKTKVEEPVEDRVSEAKETKPAVSQALSKREVSEELTTSVVVDETWAAIRKQYAADAVDIPDTSVLRPGAVVEVLYRNDKAKTVLAYHARIMDNVGDVAFYVHYANWNKRYDEWVPLQAIIKVVDLSEVGAKQYVPNGAFQSRIRNKLHTKEWAKWRPALERHVSFQTIEDNASEPNETEVAEELPPVPRPPEVKRRGRRKRSVSATTAEVSARASGSKDGESTTSAPSTVQSSSSTFSETVKPAQSLVSIVPSVTHSEKPGRTQEPVVAPSKSTRVNTPEPKRLREVIRSTSVSETPNQESTRRRKASGSSGPVEKRTLRGNKDVAEKVNLPKIVVESIAEEKAKTEETTAKLVEEKEPSKPVENLMVAETETSKKSRSTPEKIVRKSPAPESHLQGPVKISRRASTASVSNAKTTNSSAVEKSPQRNEKLKKTKQESNRNDPKIPTPVSEVVPPLEPALPSEPEKSKRGPRTGQMKRKASFSVSLDVPVAKKEKEPVPVEVLVEKDTVMPVKDSVKEAPLADLKMPTENLGNKKVLVKTGKPRGRPKAIKNLPPIVPEDIVLKAPVFATKHAAALTRLSLPLDGSEGSGATVIEEDDFGNMVKLMVEGVDLTDPDVLVGPNLTGASRIEAYEQNLVDTLLVSQLLIHRLATGYHILKRCEDRKEDGHDSDAQSDKSEPAPTRAKSSRSK